MRSVCLSILLAASIASSADRHVVVQTQSGEEISGDLLMEGERGLLIRTQQGNVMVPYADIARVQGEGASPAVGTRPPPRANEKTLWLGFHLGVGMGAGWLSAVPAATSPVAFVADAAFLLHVELGRLAVRVAFMVQPGGTQSEYTTERRFLFFGGVEPTLRLQYTPRVASAVGAQAGVMVVPSVFGLLSGFVLGPTVTPIAIRLGSERQHELSANLALQVVFGPQNVGLGTLLGTVRYALLF